MAVVVANQFTARSCWSIVTLLATSLGSSCKSTPAPQPSEPSAPATVAKAAEPPAATTTPAAPLRFAVQVGAFGDKAEADLLALRLSERFHQPVLTTPTQVGSRTLYRVRILVATKPEAEALALSLLRDDHISVWVIAPDALPPNR